MPYVTRTAERETSSRLEFEIYGFRGGLNIKSLPQLLGDEDLSAALNVYLRVDGGIEQRKGMTNRGGVMAGGAGGGIKRFWQEVVNGVPLANPALFLLANAGGTLWNVDTNAQIGTLGNLGGAAAKGWAVTRDYDADHVLAPPAAPTAALVNSGALAGRSYDIAATYVNALGETLGSVKLTQAIGANQVVRVNSPPAFGNATGWRPYAALTGNAPTLQAATLPIGTNWTEPNTGLVAGAALPATNTAIAPSDVLIICTGVGGPYIYDGAAVYTPAQYSAISGARWVEQVNGVVWFAGIGAQPNQCVYTKINQPETIAGSFSCTDSVMGLRILGAGAQAGLVVGLNSGLTVIYGVGAYNFYTQDFVFEDGVVGGMAMIALQGGIGFVGYKAAYFFNGSAVVPVSDNVEPWFLNDPLHQEYPMNGNRLISFSWEHQNRWHISYDSGGVGYCNTTLVLDLGTGGWTVLQHPPLAGATQLNAPSDPDPHATVLVSAAAGQAYNWDQYNGLGLNGHGVDDAGTAISAMFASKFFKMDGPGSTKQIDFIKPELFVEQFTGTIVVRADYSTSELVVPALAPIAASVMVWDASAWDAAQWAGNGLQFFNPRLDLGSAVNETTVEAETFSFGVQNNPTDPPFQFAGVTGIAIWNPRY